MTDDIWKRNEIHSPCVKVCVVHPGAGLCLGCLRTPGEIGRWSRLTTEERTAIMAELPSRAPLLRAANARPSRRRRRARTE